jgi:hypothetical protein
MSSKQNVNSQHLSEAIGWIDAQGIALLLTVAALAVVLGTAALWIGLR